VSFRSVYAVTDAWRESGWPEGLRWRLLLWVARNLDDKSLTLLRSQQRLAEELRVTDRYVRTVMSYWKHADVLVCVQRGGGKTRKPALYRLNLDALELVARQNADSQVAAQDLSPEVQEFRVAENDPLLRNSKSSGESSPTPDIQEFRSNEPDASSSGESVVLRNSSASGGCGYSGTPGVPTLHRRSQIQRREETEVAPPESETTTPPRSLARTAEGRLASARTGNVNEESAEVRARRLQAAALLEKLKRES
jgi:hypothetical protein